MHLNDSEFANIVRQTPLVSIDLCILKDRRILLGRRLNSPAKDYFFVPGGRIRKEEPIMIAFKRILNEELGLEILNENHKSFLGVYEHFYQNNFKDNNLFKTHYVVLAYSINHNNLKSNNFEKPFKDQHSEYIWHSIDAKIENLPIHDYTKNYFSKI